MDTAEIKKRLEQAADVIRRLPPPRRPQGYSSSWPDVLNEASESYGYGTVNVRPSPPQGQEIDDAWEAYGWLGYLQDRDRDIVWSWAQRKFDWWEIAGKVRRSERTVQRWFADAIDRIALGVKKKVDSVVRQNVGF